MDTTLYWNEWLGLYNSLDWVWLYDPQTEQLYQQVSPGLFQAIQTSSGGGYSSPQLYPYSTEPISYYPPYPQYPQVDNRTPAPARPNLPIYVAPPAVGSTVGIRTVQPTQPTQPTQPAQPTQQPPRVTVAPAPAAPVSSQPSGQYQNAPPPRTGGKVAMKPNTPKPSDGYWEAVGFIGYWKEFPDKDQFYNSGLPIKNVRLTDGRPFPYGRLAIMQGRGDKSNIYFLVYDSSTEGISEPGWKTPGDTLRGAQVRATLPF